MSGVDPEQVRYVARLARLELSEDEVVRLAEEMDEVLSRFAELEAAERDAGPSSRGGDESPGNGPSLRPDRPDADALARGPEEVAPEWRDGFFLVPRLEALGGDGGDGRGETG